MALPEINQSIPPEKLRMLLNYDSSTGNLFWKPRNADLLSFFPHLKEKSLQAFNVKHAGKLALNYRSSKGYLCGTILGLSIKAHRAAFCVHWGEWPSEVDHINGNKSDNRISNLRNVTRSQNCRNRRLRTDNTSGTPGVTFNRRNKYWEVTISDGVGEHRFVGGFYKLSDAVEARLHAQKSRGYLPNHGKTKSEKGEIQC